MTMALGRRELFVYWKVQSRVAADALSATRAMQRTLQASHPALHMRLYLRDDGRSGLATLMETYALDSGTDGIDAALRQSIEQAAATLVRWQSGARHVEVFEAVGD
jgi:Domain of unknown function (DUF4936)